VDFVSETDEHMAVKYLKDNWVNYSNEYTKKLIIKLSNDEYAFRDKAYPGENSLFFFSRKISDGKNQTTQCSKRDVMKYIDGEMLVKFFPKVQGISEIVKLLLLITEALLVLNKEIIRGDLKEENVMVSTKNNEMKIIMIDFGNSCFLTDESADRGWGDLNKSQHIAPERFWSNHLGNLAPNTNQDVYSLGYMLSSLLRYHNKKQEIDNLFPSIAAFINKALDEKPENRPLLTDFHDKLTDEYVAFIGQVDMKRACSIK